MIMAVPVPIAVARYRVLTLVTENFSKHGRHVATSLVLRSAVEISEHFAREHDDFGNPGCGACAEHKEPHEPVCDGENRVWPESDPFAYDLCSCAMTLIKKFFFPCPEADNILYN